jgi:tryptophan synthase alpha chain
MGLEPFVRKAHEAGIDGVLVVDYPPEESENFAALMKAHEMDTIFLLAPTSTEARMEKIGRIASGYVYYVSLTGVTGAASLNPDEVRSVIPAIRKHVSIPVCVGFGIRDGETARVVGSLSDGVVIGSRLIQVLENAEKNREEADLEAFMTDIRKALDG